MTTALTAAGGAANRLESETLEWVLADASRMAMRFTYTGIEVKDLDQSIAFYRDALGMEYLGHHTIESTGGEVAAFKNPGSEHVLEMNWYPNSKYRAGSELDHLAFECDDAEREVQRLLKAGATMARPVEIRPKYIVGFVKDPNGIWLELYQARA